MANKDQVISNIELEVRAAFNKADVILNILYAMEEYPEYKSMYYGLDTQPKRTLRALADSLHQMAEAQYDFLDDLVDRIAVWKNME